MHPALLAVPAALALAACGTIAPPAATADHLVGTWQIDLRPSPDAAPYVQPFVVTGVREGTFTGTFYGAPVSQARLNTRWGAVHLAFVTEDASGAHHHAAVLRDGRLEGTTNSTGRDFLACWSGTRQAP